MPKERALFLLLALAAAAGALGAILAERLPPLQTSRVLVFGILLGLASFCLKRAIRARARK